MKQLLFNHTLKATLLSFILSIFMLQSGFAQQVTVKGKITAVADGMPIPGANVLVKGTKIGTVTDFDGNYSIAVNSKSILVFSFIGYTAIEKPVNGQKIINATLGEESSTLNEVVVVGYGTQKKSDVTGAISRANIDDFRNSPNANIGQSLQGSVAGLNVGQVTSAGSTPSISIRGNSTISGNNKVLIVLDGIQYNNSLESINPDDIASIDVLKDASSTAVYGAQAANGVLLITTKKGKPNQKPLISYFSSYSTQSQSGNLRPMNRDEYLEHVRQLYYREAYLAPEFTTPNPAFNLVSKIDQSMKDSNGKLLDNNFDWYGAGTRQGDIAENRFSISGGGTNVKYLISLGLIEQKGTIINDNFKRKSIRVNLESNATNWWKIGIQSFASFVDKDGSEPNINDIIRSSPLLVPYDKDGKLIPSPFNTLDKNPFLTYDVDDFERHDSFFANIYSEIDFPFLKGLTYRTNFGNNYRTNRHFGASQYDAGYTGKAFKDYNFYYDYTLDNILTYKKEFGKHKIEGTLLYGAIRRQYEESNAYGTGFTRLTLGYNSLELAQNQYIASDGYNESLNYQMARLNYQYNNRYFITGTIRRDGFSGFATNNKYGVFPSVSGGWNISNESFFKADWVNTLKIRAGYGVSGNQTSRYSSLATLTTRASYVFGDGGVPAFGQEQSSLPNADLRWEKTSGANIGVDFNLFRNRISGSVDYYKNNTKDLLFNVKIPKITGFDNISTNIGEIENSGLEITLNTTNIRTTDFEWSSSINFSTNQNKVVALTGKDNNADGKEDDLIASNLFIGKPLGTIFGYRTAGIYQVDDQDIRAGYFPGTFRIVDRNNDGLITSDDRKILGSDNPAYRVSFMNRFSYKNFSLSVFLNSIQGGKDGYLGSVNNPIIRNDNNIRWNYLSATNYWQPNNPGGDQPLSQVSPSIVPDVFKDRSFIRLQDVNLSYDLDKDLIKKLKLDRLSLFVSGKNLATWTKWKGWDPESNQALTVGGRPVMKSYSLGLNVSF